MSNAAFFAGIRKIVGKLDQTQVDSINAIMAAADKRGITNPDMLGYFLATGWHEAQLRPVREGFKKTDAAARLYVQKHYPDKYGKPAGPYGHWYYGRGLVQLTWHQNYKDVGRKIGIDLERYPDKALEPDTAATILVDGMLGGWFNSSGHGLAHYLGGNTLDWKGARKTVNVYDKWQTFRDTAIKFAKVIRSTQYAPEPPQQPADAPDANSAPDYTETETHWLVRLIRILIGAIK